MPLGTFGNCPVGVARAPGYSNVDLVLSKRFEMGGQRYLEFRVEAFNAAQPPELRPAGARHLGSRTRSALITNTISSPRVIELALKFYF